MQSGCLCCNCILAKRFYGIAYAQTALHDVDSLQCMLQLAGYLPGVVHESGQTYFDADTSMQAYFPETDSNIASSSFAPALDASAGASSGGL